MYGKKAILAAGGWVLKITYKNEGIEKICTNASAAGAETWAQDGRSHSHKNRPSWHRLIR